MSNAAFKANFAKVLEKVGKDAEQVVRATALDLLKDMIMMSPVDKGTFKGNWQCGIGSINYGTGLRADTTPLKSYDPSAALGTANGTMNTWRIGETIYMTNSMSYSRVLEYGRANGMPGSIQAPNGMVRISVQNLESHMKKAAEQIK